MAFCSNCGAKLNDGAKFCSECGTTINETIRTSAAQRKQEFAGEIIKCPNCGEILQSFMTHCPSCGFELRKLEATDSIREFAQKMSVIYQSGIKVKKRRLSLFSQSISPEADSAINLIRNFAIPNSREAILEFMILASSNVDPDSFEEGHGIPDIQRQALSSAWFAKMEQAYRKAELSFGNDEEMNRIREIYLSSKKSIKRAKTAVWRLLGIVYGILFAIIIIVVIILILSPEPTIEDKIKNRESHLDYAVEQIEDNVADGKYTDARNIAYTLTFDSELSEEKHVYWENRQKEMLDTIDKAENNKTRNNNQETNSNSSSIDNSEKGE